jgi:hypothetical protein
MKPPESLDQRLDADFAPAWVPEVGDKLVGEVVALSERRGNFGVYPIVTVRRDDGEELAVHAYHSVLADRLAKAGPKRGERIGIKYEGEVDGAGDRRYHRYKVVVDRPDGDDIDWSRYSEDELLNAAPASDVPTEVTRPHAPLEQGKDDDIPF